MYRRLVMGLIACSLLVAPIPGYADGMPIVDGRYRGEKSTVITLSKSQIQLLEKQRILLLTNEQKKQLRREANVAPSELLIYDTRVGENDCTCSAFNRGLRFSQTEVDVPHEYLVSDEQVKEQHLSFGGPHEDEQPALLENSDQRLIDRFIRK